MLSWGTCFSKFVAHADTRMKNSAIYFTPPSLFRDHVVYLDGCIHAIYLRYEEEKFN